MPKSERRALIGLHLLLAVYSLSDVCSTTAAGAPFMSFRFLFFYGCVLGLVGVSALGWQQVIRRLPLTVAFANRAVTVVWGIVWGVLFFREQVSPLRLVGAALIMAGVVLFARADGRQAEEERKDG